MTSLTKILGANSKTRQFRKAEFLGRKALFTDLRLARETVPNGIAAYDLREGDGPEYNEYGEPLPPSLSIAPSVIVNHFGTILVAGRFESVEHEERALDENDWGFGSIEVSLAEGISWLKNRVPFGAGD